MREVHDRVIGEWLSETQPAIAPQPHATPVYVQNRFVFIANERAVAALVVQPECLTSTHDARVVTRNLKVTIGIAADPKLPAISEDQRALSSAK